MEPKRLTALPEAMSFWRAEGAILGTTKLAADENAQGRLQRSLSVREREEVQALLRPQSAAG